MINGVGILLNLTLEEANNLIALINRAQITGAEAVAVVLLKQQIEHGIQDYRDRSFQGRTPPSPEGPEPAEEREA